MSRVTNEEVIFEWKKHRPAKNHRDSLKTDGQKLWSYGLQIGDTCADTGLKVLRDYTARGRGFKSQTTSCHVGLAKRMADVVD